MRCGENKARGGSVRRMSVSRMSGMKKHVARTSAFAEKRISGQGLLGKAGQGSLHFLLQKGITFAKADLHFSRSRFSHACFFD